MILYLDVARAAQAVSMSPRWIRQQVAAGLPVLRTEGKILVSPETLRGWMEKRFGQKDVDLGAAFAMATELTGGGRRRGKAGR
jgi:hypothetical protein